MQQPARERALSAARNAWGPRWTPRVLARAPGRLELLGNHVDYNGGRVLACAIDRDVSVVFGEGGESLTVLAADVGAEPVDLRPDQLVDWRNTSASLASVDYVRGVVATGLARGAAIRTGRLAFAGDVPIGFGLSSSAALCVAVTEALHDPSPTGSELVLRAQEAEHRAGTPCGTMDQSASVGGHVILFDSATVSWKAITPSLGDYAFAVADSGVQRSLAVSSYGKRVEESRQALERANAVLGTTRANLSEFTVGELRTLERAEDGAFDATLLRRMRHIVMERERVAEGVLAMEASDWVRFGQLMTAAGRSSALDYEISHPRVEAVVAAALTVSGVAGARMMGGGEGGVALVLLRRDATDALRAELDRAYYREHGMSAADAVMTFRFAPGASIEIA